jgi:hypothetical protein
MLPDWAGQRVVCIASGPSLTLDDCELVRESRLPTIVTNTTFRQCFWAAALFGFDPPWWNAYLAEVRALFTGRLFSKSSALRKQGVEWVGNGFQSFGISGTDAISMAMRCGSRDITLLGYDCQLTEGRTHHHGDHPAWLKDCRRDMWAWPIKFKRLAVYAEHMGATVVNASRATALDCFTRKPLEACL